LPARTPVAVLQGRVACCGPKAKSSHEGIRVDKPADIASAWDEALRADRPVVIEFITDPNVPPLPPHVESKQALAYLKALAAGDPDRWNVIKQSAKQLLPF
jgi:pyruvate dehydrogenase (quinone)